MEEPAKHESRESVEEGACSPPPKLKNTGERFLPGTTGSADVAYDHIARYRFAERYVQGKKTIDLGCGAGYGSHSLAGVARSVVGVDLSEEAIAYDAHHYRASNLSFEAGDVTDLPYREGSFEAAVSFEVIEHLPEPESLVEEAKRLLKEDGVFVVSTPDKQIYSNDRNSVNPHHLKEMYELEFRELLERHFEHVRIYRQGGLAGSSILPDPGGLPEDGEVSLESTKFSLLDGFGGEAPTTLYMVAVCADGEPPEPLNRPYLLLDRDRQIYDEQEDFRVMLPGILLFHDRREQALKQQLDRQRRLRNEQEKRAREQEERARRLRGQLDEQHRLTRKQKEYAQRLRGQLDAMQNSRGWKVARALNRAAARILRRG